MQNLYYTSSVSQEFGLPCGSKILRNLVYELCFCVAETKLLKRICTMTLVEAEASEVITTTTAGVAVDVANTTTNTGIVARGGCGGPGAGTEPLGFQAEVKNRVSKRVSNRVSKRVSSGR